MATEKEERLFSNMINYNKLAPIEQKAHDIEMYEHLVKEFKIIHTSIDEDT
jgi:hypothetical protein